jgi:CRP/FNR family cyclic AMP-dependent transcriptional regulator
MLVTKEIEGIDTFRDLDGKELERVRKLLVSGKYRAGEVLFHEGDPGNAMYFVLSGSVQVYRRTDSGRRQLLARIRAGHVLGEMALVDGGPRSATAKALGETRVAKLSRSDFQSLLRYESHIAALILGRIARMVSLRLRQTNAMVS